MVSNSGFALMLGSFFFGLKMLGSYIVGGDYIWASFIADLHVSFSHNIVVSIND